MTRRAWCGTCSTPWRPWGVHDDRQRPARRRARRALPRGRLRRRPRPARPTTSSSATAPPSPRRSAGAAPATTAPLAEKSRYEQSFIQCMNLWEDFADVRAADVPPAHRPGGRPSCSASTPSGSGTTRRCTSRPAAARPMPTRTIPYWPIAETASITAWIPFDGLDAGRRARWRTSPARHRIGLRKFVNIFFGEPEDILADPEVAGIEPVFVEVPKGSVVVPPRPHRAPRRRQHHRPRPGRAHDHLLRRRQHARLPAPALRRRPGRDRGRRSRSPATSPRSCGPGPTATCRCRRRPGPTTRR